MSCAVERITSNITTSSLYGRHILKQTCWKAQDVLWSTFSKRPYPIPCAVEWALLDPLPHNSCGRPVLKETDLESMCCGVPFLKRLYPIPCAAEWALPKPSNKRPYNRHLLKESPLGTFGCVAESFSQNITSCGCMCRWEY